MSAALRFNALLRDAGINPAEVRLLRHSAPNVDLFELWKQDLALFEAYQSYQKIGSRAMFASPWWASFVATSLGGTVFVGMYRATDPEPVKEEMVGLVSGKHIEANSYERYRVTRESALVDYAGRLFIDWDRGSSVMRQWRQRADSQDKTIVELRRAVGEPSYPGHLRFSASIAGLDQLPSSWAEHLAQARGVYLLTCPATGVCYVGSATGAQGFWGRWQSYAATGHGGNVAMAERPPQDYRVSILQLAGSADSVDDIIALETVWKHKLAAREAGLNRN